MNLEMLYNLCSSTLIKENKLPFAIRFIKTIKYLNFNVNVDIFDM